MTQIAHAEPAFADLPSFALSEREQARRDLARILPKDGQPQEVTAALLRHVWLTVKEAQDQEADERFERGQGPQRTVSHVTLPTVRAQLQCGNLERITRVAFGFRPYDDPALSMTACGVFLIRGDHDGPRPKPLPQVWFQRQAGSPGETLGGMARRIDALWPRMGDVLISVIDPRTDEPPQHGYRNGVKIT